MFMLKIILKKYKKYFYAFLKIKNNTLKNNRYHTIKHLSSKFLHQIKTLRLKRVLIEGNTNIFSIVRNEQLIKVKDIVGRFIEDIFDLLNMKYL